MRGYTELERAVLDKFLSVFNTKLVAERVTAGNPDQVHDEILSDETGNPYGVWTEFGGGRMDSRQPFSKLVWIWRVNGIFVIQYEGDETETSMRDIVDVMFSMFQGDHTLGNKTPYVRMISIGDAYPAEINNIKFYWIPFVIDVIDR